MTNADAAPRKQFFTLDWREEREGPRNRCSILALSAMIIVLFIMRRGQFQKGCGTPFLIPIASLQNIPLVLIIMSDTKDEEILGDVGHEKALEPSDLEHKDIDVSPKKAVPASNPSAVVDGGIKGWIVAFGGFCCL
jgi:hypothetical protein